MAASATGCAWRSPMSLSCTGMGVRRHGANESVRERRQRSKPTGALRSGDRASDSAEFMHFTGHVMLEEQDVDRNDEKVRRVNPGRVKRDDDRTPSLVKTLLDEGKVPLPLRPKRGHKKTPVNRSECLASRIQRPENP